MCVSLTSTIINESEFILIFFRNKWVQRTCDIEKKTESNPDQELGGVQAQRVTAPVRSSLEFGVHPAMGYYYGDYQYEDYKNN